MLTKFYFYEVYNKLPSVNKSGLDGPHEKKFKRKFEADV